MVYGVFLGIRRVKCKKEIIGGSLGYGLGRDCVLNNPFTETFQNTVDWVGSVIPIVFQRKNRVVSGSGETAQTKLKISFIQSRNILSVLRLVDVKTKSNHGSESDITV